jgi:predicted 3-demethylubiquinone-9 3-methyltransferase (glyoxalase superfamily)
MQKIITHLWFDDQAEQAARHYTAIFPRSKIGKIARYGAAGAQVSGRRQGSVMTVEFELDGQQFLALNGGPVFKFSEAISLVVPCENQAELDRVWNKLIEGGQAQQCGWLKDKFGVSWQVVPADIGEMMTNADAQKSERVMQAVLQMVKIDIAALRRAYEQ